VGTVEGGGRLGGLRGKALRWQRSRWVCRRARGSAKLGGSGSKPAVDPMDAYGFELESSECAIERGEGLVGWVGEGAAREEGRKQYFSIPP